uniref:oligopeptidase A n=1 Tax=Candidatus Kentrum sp. FW TaxID=2126338 RepID=A0A450RUC4_9GAMM|nr:MAG: oligopeptidase A [Candidatus Kentron sp. FW]VFJ59040.1 MAG: oligopeptidase A [Candidatus Kentron sp. FW]
MNIRTHTPWLGPDGHPAFSRIRPEDIMPTMRQLLEEARAVIAALLDERASATPTPGWDALIPPLEDLEDCLNRIWSPISHLHAVADNPALREAYNACLPMLSEYGTELGQNEQLYRAFEGIAESEEMARLTPTKRKILENSLLDFQLSGVALSTQNKARFKDISVRLSTLASKFSQNVLDATGAWKKHVTESEALSGFPESALALARQAAEREGKEGWMLTLEFPSYLSVITFADDPALRREIYEAYTTRGSDQGPDAGQWDNTEIMEEILALRNEKAKLLGFSSYLECSLVKKMVPSSDHVFDFLRDLARRARQVAQQDLREVREFARKRDAIGEIEAWDIPYYSEKLYQDKFALSQEELRAYFPVPKVLSGLFGIAQRLFGIDIQVVEGKETWHPDVRFYQVRDGNGVSRGGFYLDLYARPHKRGGAWMDECVTRKALGDDIQPPVAYLSCNFGPPTGEEPSRLTHEEVLTLFHEFGHTLHHLLTKVDYPSIAGINGVAWDAVELPSQLLEQWCWEREALQHITCHAQTGVPLPDALIKRLRSARNFQSGMAMVRQLEYALFDLRIHGEYENLQSGNNGAGIQRILQEVRDEVAVITPPAFHRLAHSFTHIFAGGYAAGYYSYKWAEMLSSDAFSKFEENGVFDRDTGSLFQRTVLEQGGSRDAMALFVAFRGREPTIDALLRHNGIEGETGDVRTASGALVA